MRGLFSFKYCLVNKNHFRIGHVMVPISVQYMVIPTHFYGYKAKNWLNRVLQVYQVSVPMSIINCQ